MVKGSLNRPCNCTVEITTDCKLTEQLKTHVISIIKNNYNWTIKYINLKLKILNHIYLFGKAAPPHVSLNKFWNVRRLVSLNFYDAERDVYTYNTKMLNVYECIKIEVVIHEYQLHCNLLLLGHTIIYYITHICNEWVLHRMCSHVGHSHQCIDWLYLCKCRELTGELIRNRVLLMTSPGGNGP